MYLLDGSIQRKVGGFNIKQPIFGIIEDYEETEDFYIVQGYELPKSSFVKPRPITSASQKLNLADFMEQPVIKKGRKKKAVKNEDESLTEFKRLDAKWSNVLAEAVKDAKRYKRAYNALMVEGVPAERDALREELDFAIYIGNEYRKEYVLDALLSLYVRAIYDVDDAPTYNQLTKRMLKS